MTFREAREQFRSSLREMYSSGEIRELFSRMVVDLVGRSWSSVLADEHSEIPAPQGKKLIEYLHRLKKGEPYQYIQGYTEFYGHRINLNAHTLIPRPETEELVDIINIRIPRAQRILDIGTGSGCIVIALSGIYPASMITAVDISAEALRIAGENAGLNKVQVKFLQMDILRDFPEGEFDLIVSNPPYIPESEKSSMDRQVTDHEPPSALFTSNADPLIFYRRIAESSREHLSAGGNIFTEIHQEMGEETSGIFRNNGWKTEVLHDLSGNERFLKATL